MEQTRFEQGIEQLRKIDGIGGENVIKSLEDVAPAVGKYIPTRISSFTGSQKWSVS